MLLVVLSVSAEIRDGFYLLPYIHSTRHCQDLQLSGFSGFFFFYENNGMQKKELQKCRPADMGLESFFF